MLLDKLVSLKLIEAPSWISGNCQWLVLSGSHSYGCHTDESDKDYTGFCIPRLEDLFPFSHGGKLYGYDSVEVFEEYSGKSEYYKDNPSSDWKIYSIVKLFSLLQANNPNCLDILFVPRNLVVHSTKVGEMVRAKRHMFLSKKLFETHRGYAYRMLNKAKSKEPEVGSKRYELREKYGVDTKYLYNVFRLLSQAEQYLFIGDVDLQKDREIYADIRSGKWSIEKVEEVFKIKEKNLAKLYEENKSLPDEAPKRDIKALLMHCLEEWYGNLDKFVKTIDRESWAIGEIKKIIEAI